MNHVSISPTNGNGPTQGQRKALTRVGIGPLLTIESPVAQWLEHPTRSLRGGHGFQSHPIFSEFPRDAISKHIYQAQVLGEKIV